MVPREGIEPPLVAYLPAELVWCPREESNLYIRLRSPEFYPLNYEGARRGRRGSPQFYPLPASTIIQIILADPPKYSN